jgi:hypothetical protein
VLAVVDHQQGPLADQVSCHCVERRLAGLLTQCQGLGERPAHGMIPSARRDRQLREPDPSRKLPQGLLRYLQRQAGLAGSAGTGQRNQPVLLQQDSQFAAGAITPDERAEREREIVPGA